MKREKLLEWLNNFYDRSIDNLKRKAGEQYEQLTRDAISIYAKLRKRFPQLHHNSNEAGYEIVRAVNEVQAPPEYRQLLVVRIILLGTNDTINEITNKPPDDGEEFIVPQLEDSDDTPSEENCSECTEDCPANLNQGSEFSRYGDGTLYRKSPGERWFG